MRRFRERLRRSSASMSSVLMGLTLVAPIVVLSAGPMPAAMQDAAGGPVAGGPILPPGTPWWAALLTMALFFVIQSTKAAFEFWTKYRYRGENDRRKTEGTVAVALAAEDAKKRDEVHDVAVRLRESLLVVDPVSRRTALDQLIVQHGKVLDNQERVLARMTDYVNEADRRHAALEAAIQTLARRHET